MKTPALKILTVSVFATLIVLFVCYRVGVFDNDSVSQTYSEVDKSNFDSNSSNTAIDTPIVNKDSVFMDREMMSSSKSMKISRPIKTDSTQKKSTSSSESTNSKPAIKTTIMSSSKSAIIFEPAPAKDSTKKPKK